MSELGQAAERAALVGQIRSFVAWVGAGRKLTQTGKIGLADARHLGRRGVAAARLGAADTVRNRPLA